MEYKRIRLFDYKGVEIIEEADLWKFIDNTEKCKTIFFTKNNENFESKNVLRQFKFIKKLGEVRDIV